MINKPRFENEDNGKKLPIEPFHIEVDFLQKEKNEEDVYKQIREVIKIECKKIHESYDMEVSYVMLVSFVVEILKNIRFHGGGRGYISFEREREPLTGKDILHIVEGDFGKGMPMERGFSLEKNFLGGEDGKERFERDRIEGTYGIGGGIIQGLAEGLEMHLMMYNNGQPFLLHNALNEYKWEPQEIDMSQGVHFVGSMLLPLKENFIVKRDFDYGFEVKDAEAWGELTYKRVKYLSEDPIISGYIENKDIAAPLMGIYNEILKNVHSHGGGVGYITIVPEQEVTMGEILLHFAIGDYGPGVKRTADSYENFYEDGYTTASPDSELSGHGHGGSKVRNNAQYLDMQLVLYDNGEREVVHQPNKRYDWMPEGRDMSKGAHFVGTFVLKK